MNRRKRMEMLQNMQFTSKAALKMHCLQVAMGNVKEASELYEFFVKDMTNLPDFDPVKPTFLDSTKDTVNGLMGWFKENQDTIAQGVEFFRGVFKKAPSVPTTPVEPLPPID